MTKEAMLNYSAPNMSHPIDFAPGRSLHDDEWFKIVLEEDQVASMVGPYLNNAVGNANNAVIKAEDYQKVTALYKTDGNTLLLTKITPGMRVESKTFIGLNDHPEVKSYNKAIEFTGQVDAYYAGSGNLYFRKYTTISSLFDGIEVFYRDATEPERVQFLAKDFLAVDGMDTTQIGKRDSNKIAMILDDDRIKLDDADFQLKAIAYAKEFQPALVSEDNKLKITDKKSLSGVLDVLMESYYKSGLFGDKRVAHDSTKLDA